jgi:hypothetical protein
MKYTAHEHLKAALGLAPGALSAAETLGPVVDRLGFREALVVALFGTASASGEADVTVMHGDESDGSDMAAISGAAFTQVTTANDEALYVGRLDLEGLKRYLQVKNVGDGSNAVDLGVAIILGNGRVLPVTQENAVAFNIQ